MLNSPTGRSLPLAFSHSVSIMLVPWPKVVLSAARTPAGIDNVAAFIKRLTRRAWCRLRQEHSLEKSMHEKRS